MIKNLLTILLIVLGFYCQAQKILLLDKVGTGKRKRIFEKEVIHIRLENGKHFQSPFMFSDDNKFILMSDTVVALSAIDKVYSKGSKRMANVLTQTGKYGMIGSLIIFPFNGLINNDSPIVHKAFYPVFGGALLLNLFGRALDDRGFKTKPGKRELRVLDLSPANNSAQ